MTISVAAHFLRNPDVVLQEEDPDEGALLFNRDTNQVKVINTTGLFIWQQCGVARTLDEIIVEVQKGFNEVPSGQVAGDVQEFMGGMVATGFIGTVEGGCPRLTTPQSPRLPENFGEAWTVHGLQQEAAQRSAYVSAQSALQNAPAPPAPSNGSGSPAPTGAAQASSNVASPSNGASAGQAAATAPARMQVSFTLADLHEALEVVRQLDPPGVACRDLRECLLRQLDYHRQQLHQGRNGESTATEQVLNDAVAVVDHHLHAVTLKQFKEIAKAMGRPIEAVQAALEYIRTLDPRPGLQYNKTPARLIEPDVAFVKHGDEWLIIMNDEDMPQLRLNPAYKRLLTREGNDKDTRNYVKDRYKSAIQLIKNIEQRKQTISEVCYSIVARQQDFLERGIDQLKPMMIKEVAEEIGVHPSTVSRAVANKYVHTPQGVFELRYFFSESVQGPEGGGTSLLILKRRVKKLIEDEDPSRPLTDEQITRILQSQGIDVTRRTVAKYREDMKIPSTHQRRVKK